MFIQLLINANVWTKEWAPVNYVHIANTCFVCRVATTEGVRCTYMRVQNQLCTFINSKNFWCVWPFWLAGLLRALPHAFFIFRWPTSIQFKTLTYSFCGCIFSVPFHCVPFLSMSVFQWMLTFLWGVCMCVAMVSFCHCSYSFDIPFASNVLANRSCWVSVFLSSKGRKTD